MPVKRRSEPISVKKIVKYNNAYLIFFMVTDS